MADVVRDPEQDLTRICSWCGQVVYQGRSGVPTHGICGRCLTLELLRQREDARRGGRAANTQAADNTASHK
jgi:hypothetical protein